MILRVLFILISSTTLVFSQPRSWNYCLDLDGKTAGGKIEHIDGLQSIKGAREYTFEAWVRPRTQGGGGRGRILDQEKSGLTFYLSDDARIGFRPSRDAGWQLSEKGAVTYWKWQHVAVTYDGKSLRFFVDGKLFSASVVDVPLTITRKPVWIGNGIGDDDKPRGFDGWLDDVRVSSTCRWTSNFVPPVRGKYAAADEATVLYLAFDEGPAYDIVLDYTPYNAEFIVQGTLKRVKSP